MNLSINRKKVAIAVIALAGVILILLLLVRLAVPTERIRQAIQEQLSKSLNQEVAVESVSVGFYPDLEFVGRGISVAEPGADRELVSVQKVRLDLDLSKLLKRQYVVENIVVGSPTVGLVRDHGGEWNIRKLLAGVAASREAAKKKPEPGREVKRPKIGPIRINNGVITVHDQASGRTLTVRRIAATLDLESETLTIKSAFVSYPPIRAKVSGTVSRFSEPSPLLDIDSEIQVLKEGPLADAGPGLAAGDEIAEVSLSASGPVAEVTIESIFSVNQKVTRGLTAKGRLDGTLTREEGALRVTALETRLGQSTLSFSGVCTNLWTDQRKAALEGTGRLVLAEVLSLGGEGLVKRMEPQGSADASLVLAASMQSVTLTADLDLSGAGLVIPDVIEKAPGAPATLALSARYLAPDDIVVDNFNLEIGGGQLDGTARVAPGEEPWAEASLSASEFPLESLNRLPSFMFEKGAATLEAQVWQSSPSETRVSHRGRATIRDAAVVAQQLKEPLEGLDADLEWTDRKARVNSASFQFAGSTIHTQAEVIEFAKPEVTGRLRADTLDVNRIAKAVRGNEQKDEAPAASEPARPRASEALSITLALEAGSVYAGALHTGALSTTWRMSDQFHRLDPLDFSVFGGKAGATVTLDASAAPMRWRTEFKGQGMKLAELRSQLDSGKTKLTGLLDAEGNLEGVVAGESKDILQSIDGELKFTAKDGEIKQYSLLKNIVLLMQVPVGPALLPGVRELAALNTVLEAAKTRGRSLDPTSITFNEIDGALQLTHGVAHTEDLRLESGMVDLICKGDVDLVEQQMDMNITATPMGAIGSLLGMVPVAGKTLKGAKEKVVSTDFLVSGPISDPDVKLATVEKMKNGIGGAVNGMKNKIGGKDEGQNKSLSDPFAP